MLYILVIILSILSVPLTSHSAKSWIKQLYLLLVFLNILVLGIYIFLDYLSGNGINEAVIYHLYFGIKGFGIVDYIKPIFFFLLFVIFSFISIYLIQVKIKLPKEKIFLVKKISLFSLVLSFALNPFFYNIYQLSNYKSINYSGQDSGNYNFLMQADDILFPKIKKNIIYLYLEQFERTYFNETLFPGLTPNLKRLEKTAVTFTDIQSPKATNWTIAGMVASQCGIPLFVPDYRGNSMSGMDKFLPLANCLGDILSKHRYSLHYLGGSNLDFAGKGQYYRSHGFHSVEGLEDLSKSMPDKSYLSPWGLYDDTLYSAIESKAQTLDLAGELFGIFSLTLDTHHPDGYMSRSCKDLIYGDGKNPILNSIHCADFMAARFIETLMSSQIFNNTTIVLSSDHLALRNSAKSLLDKGNRKNLFLIFDSNLSPRTISKPGSVFDIAPTVLSAMGSHVKGLGFGRNLFLESSLINSKFSIEEIIEQNRKNILRLWSFPQIDETFQISHRNNHVIFNSRKIKLPVLILLDEFFQVDEMRFDFYYSNPLLNEVKSLNGSRNLLWIDKCTSIFDFKKLDLVFDDTQYCSYMHRNRDSNFSITDLQIDTLDFKQFRSFFSN